MDTGLSADLIRARLDAGTLTLKKESLFLPVIPGLNFSGKNAIICPMSEYSEFSRVYDLFMDDIPYEDWCERIVKILKDRGIHDGLVCELGCGTGTMTELLAEAGYDMTGIDRSESMLQEALMKRDEGGHAILYLCQDIREFELYGTMRAFVAVCDTMNYLLTEQELLTVFKLVNNYLDPEGVFIFDMKTRHFFKDVLGERTEADNEEEASYIWENYFDEETDLNEYALTIFERLENGLFEKSEEFHQQRAYDIEIIKALAEEAGMVFLKVMDESGKEPDENSERLIYLLREKGKKNYE